MQILLVEDHDLLGVAMKSALEQDGYDVRWCRDGEAAASALTQARFDLVLLDLGLPVLSGEELLRQVRRQSVYIPVIIVTARDHPRHRVAGLDAGADDFVVKPVDLAELAARIRAQIRRQDGRLSDILALGNVEIDLAGRVVRRDGRPVHLTAKEFKLAALLARRAGRFVSQSDLADELYDGGRDYDSNTIEVAISAIRRKLGADFVITARGLGYTIPK
ncbi:response regulator transcription factor [Gluconacetobacter sacchari]|uniref:Response regulator transcription factor n=2 Tax=Gluconacetobacter sacchari TaxID=92759 RepID=A0A7W4NL63_9PROT|nr:response regulator transcription factor [Gluconacetobacter sacchari]MBB2159762.1 response regulator transcription factor [Gluconacetobacter sacchari]GBQ23495.1 two component response regulator [Gluconacetobacter sacchari DSM 12717]